MSNEENYDLIAETENFGVHRLEHEGELFYHVELVNLTLHFTAEEWDEFAILIRDASK